MRAGRFLHFSLNRVKAKIKLVEAGAALLWILAAVAAWLLVIAAIDQARPMSTASRQTLTIILVALTAVAVVIWILVPLARRISDLYAASLIEHHHPEFKNSLISFLELEAADDIKTGSGPPPAGKVSGLPAVRVAGIGSEDGGPTSDISLLTSDFCLLTSDIIAAVEAKAARDIAEVQVEESVPTRRLKHPAIASGAMVLAVVLFALLSPKPLWPTLCRAVGLDQAPPTLTQILSIVPEDGTRVVEGEDVTVSAVIAGRRPQDVRLIHRMLRNHRSLRETSTNQHEWHTLNMEPPQEQRQWTCVIENLTRDLAFRIQAGDALSRAHRIIVRPIPDVLGINVRLTYPSHTGRKPFTLDGGNITAPVDTEVRLTAHTNVRPQGGELRFQDGSRKAMHLGQDGRSLAATFRIKDNQTYSIRFNDGGDPLLYNRKEIKYRIRALPDMRTKSPVKPETAAEKHPERQKPTSGTAEKGEIQKGKTQEGPPPAEKTAAAEARARLAEMVHNDRESLRRLQASMGRSTPAERKPPAEHKSEAAEQSQKDTSASGQADSRPGTRTDKGTSGESGPGAGNRQQSQPDAGEGKSGRGGEARAGERPVDSLPKESKPPRPDADFLSGPQVSAEDLDTVGRLIREAAGQLQTHRVDERFLSEVGMTEPQLKRFVTKYQRELSKAASGPLRTEPPGNERVIGVPLPPGEVRIATEPSRTISEISAPLNAQPDKLKGVIESERRRVSPRYRDLVSEYFKAISAIEKR